MTRVLVPDNTPIRVAAAVGSSIVLLKTGVAYLDIIDADKKPKQTLCSILHVDIVLSTLISRFSGLYNVVVPASVPSHNYIIINFADNGIE